MGVGEALGADVISTNGSATEAGADAHALTMRQVRRILQYVDNFITGIGSGLQVGPACLDQGVDVAGLGVSDGTTVSVTGTEVRVA